MEIQLFAQSSNQILGQSKSDLNEFAIQFASAMEGHDSLKLIASIAKFQHLLSELDKKLKDQAINDLLLCDGSKSNAFGVEFSVMESGVKYDYSANEKWNELDAEINSLKEKQKDIEAFCKSLKSATTTVDEETGEAIKWFPPAKSSTTTIKKTIK